MATLTPAPRNQQQGSALPVTLLLLSVMSLLSVNALQTATVETKLAESLLLAGDTFAHAELGIVSGLRFATDNPGRLPTTTPLQLTAIATDDLSTVGISIKPTAVDNICPLLAPLPAERLHFEIRAKVISNSRAETTHVQGFYVCRETCTDACLGVESAPVKSYWTIDDEE